MSILLFLGVLFVLILVHEWGHYITAKWTGMKVEEFGIGFPPRAISWMRGETRWSLNWLPIGGFVRILGENGLSEEEGGVAEVDKQRSFNARPKWAQIVVLLAGVTMNMVLAWFLIVATHTIGVATPVSEADASPQAELVIAEVVPNGPADGSLPLGATIVGISGVQQTEGLLTPTQFSDAIAGSAGAPVLVDYIFNNEAQQVTITAVQGLSDEDPERYLIGVRPVLVEDRSVGIIEALQLGTAETWARTQYVFSGLTSLIATSIAGTADYSQVAGPIGIAVMTDDVAQLGIVALLQFMAMLSISLAVINLLPVPALDGGRIVFVLIEAVTGKDIPPHWTGYVNLAGFAMLMLLMVLVTYNDIVRLVS